MRQSNSNAPFSKDELGAELKKILYIQASQLSHSASAHAAFTFLGFSCDFLPTLPIVDEDVERIDLSRFSAWGMMKRAYDYAFQVENFWNFDEEVYIGILALANGITPVAISGEVSPYHLPNSRCRHVVDLAVGRYHLEVKGKKPLPVRQLSLLANMAEAAVRNSLSAKKLRSPLDSGIALNWLKGRKCFVATRTDEN